MPIGSGAMYTKVWQGFEQFRRLGLSEGAQPRLYGGQAEGCAPVAAAFAEDRRVSPVRPDSVVSSIAIGNPADGDLAIATAKAVRRRDLRGARGRGRRRTSRCSPRPAGIFGEGATGVTVGALREAVARGEIGEGDRVVVLVTGTGLKTPQVGRGGRDGSTRRDRRRRRRAARRARSDRERASTRREPQSRHRAMTSSRAARGDHRGRPRARRRRQPAARDRAAAARAQAARTAFRCATTAARSRCCALLADENGGPLSDGRARRLLPHVLDLTRRELHGA